MVYVCVNPEVRLIFASAVDGPVSTLCFVRLVFPSILS